jgi:uncharacterized OB-fold protein
MKPGRPRTNPRRRGESRQSASLRAKREEWRLAGLCPVCGSARAPARSKCEPCLRRSREWIAARRAKE